MDDLIQAVLDSVLDDGPSGIIGVYLYGSSTTTGLSAESDVDLLLVTRRSMLAKERRSLVSSTVEFSGWKGHAKDFPDVADRRPLDVTSLVADDIEPLTAVPRRDFQFGEWLRRDFTQGHVPVPEWDPDVVILLATALASHQVLHGPSLDRLVADVPSTLLKGAQLGCHTSTCRRSGRRRSQCTADPGARSSYGGDWRDRVESSCGRHRGEACQYFWRGTTSCCGSRVPRRRAGRLGS